MKIRESYHRLFMIALAAAIVSIPLLNGTSRSAMPELAIPFQRATAQLKIDPTSATFNWPNDGVMQILTYGWGGDRPLPVAMAIDSSRVFRSDEGGRPPILIVQRRQDIFSPLLQELVDQKATAPTMVLTIEPVARASMSYTMRNVRVVGIRNVGSVIEENPVTQEIVFTFDSVAIGSIDSPGR